MAKSRRCGVLLALIAGCTSAPLAGKPCPCATDLGYTCCETTMMCVTNAALCPCRSAKAKNGLVTGNGLPPPTPDISPTDGQPELKFGVSPEQWVSYAYSGAKPPPDVSASPDGNGIHVVATFNHAPGQGQTYEGAGLSFVGDFCINGTELTGVQFDFDGNLGGRQLEVGVTSSEDLDSMFTHGTCTAGAMMCYGPTAPISPMLGTNFVAFTDLTVVGKPVERLDTSDIVNVQWQLHDADDPNAQFTITNVMFY